MRRKTRILIVDQESLLRDGLRALLELEDELEMMGAISSGD
jgi:DNA-binding NarL/FixJ family response regulator